MLETDCFRIHLDKISRYAANNINLYINRVFKSEKGIYFNQVDQEDTNGCGSPNEEDDLSNCGDTPRGSWASLDLRHSQHDPLLPSLLDRVCLETIDQMNEQKRLEDRQVDNCYMPRLQMLF